MLFSFPKAELFINKLFLTNIRLFAIYSIKYLMSAFPFSGKVFFYINPTFYFLEILKF